MCPRKHPAKTGLIKLSNDEAANYGHDISSELQHRAGLRRQTFKRSRRADDVDYCEINS